LARLLPFAGAALLLLASLLGIDGLSPPFAGIFSSLPPLPGQGDDLLPLEVGRAIAAVLPGLTAAGLGVILARLPRRVPRPPDRPAAAPRLHTRTRPAAALTLARRRLAAPLAAAGAVLVVSPLPEVQASLRDLNEIFTRLLEEAIRQHPPGQRPVLHLSAHAEGTHVIFQLFGGGFAAERDGIGVTIIRWRIESAGGRLWLAPPALVFTLPAASA